MSCDSGQECAGFSKCSPIAKAENPMIRHSLTLSSFLVVSLASIAFTPGAWDWGFLPSDLSSPGSLTVSVTEAPAAPVVVKFTIGSTTYTQTLTSIPGSVQFDIPPGHSQGTAEITLTAGGEQVTRDVTIQ